MKNHISKRILCLMLASVITFSSVSYSYYESVEGAEFVAGLVGAIGGAPLLTALVIGGVVVAGGIAIYEFSQTDAEDYREFASGIKQGFQEFVTEQETIIAKENDSTLSDQEAADQGVAIAREKINGWWDSAINTTRNTTGKIRFDVQKYWELYSKIIGDVADMPTITGGITADTVINPPLVNNSAYNFALQTNLGANCINYDGHYYINNGAVDNNTVQNTENTTSDRIRIIACGLALGDFAYLDVNRIDINKLTGAIIVQSITRVRTFRGYTAETLQAALSRTNIPTFVYDANANPSDMTEPFKTWCSDYVRNLSIGTGDVQIDKNYKQTIKDTLDNTKAGNAIQTGRRELVKDGDHITAVFKEDSVPIKKSSVRANDTTATGDIGWDIPSSDAWDDYLTGNTTMKDIMTETGTVAVPDDVIVGVNDPDRPVDDDTSVEFPKDTPVQDSSDYPDERDDVDDPSIPDNPPKPEEIPDKPFQDVIDEQGGTFYPTEMDLTTLFPFCIPFDVIYLVQKFDANGENAPVITIPIIYPHAIQGVMGSDRYDVVIDFQDFLVVRNVLRVFLLLLFIAGLMKITRDLIRG